MKPAIVVMGKITLQQAFGGFGRPIHNNYQIRCAQSHHVQECCEKLQCTNSPQGWQRAWSARAPPSCLISELFKKLRTEWAMNWLPLSLRKMTPFSSWLRFIRRKRLIKSIWRTLPWNSQSRILRPLRRSDIHINDAQQIVIPSFPVYPDVFDVPSQRRTVTNILRVWSLQFVWIERTPACPSAGSLYLKVNYAPACADTPFSCWWYTLFSTASAVRFKCFKTNEFNLQQMNFKNPLKISLLMAIIVFAYVLCLLEGLKQRKQITTKRYRSGAIGPAQSFSNEASSKSVRNYWTLVDSWNRLKPGLTLVLGSNGVLSRSLKVLYHFYRIP